MSYLISGMGVMSLAVPVPRPGTPGGVVSIGLEAYDADAVEAAAGRARDAGWRVLSRAPSLDIMDASVTLASDEGLVFEIHTPVPTDQPIRYATAGVAPRKLDHVGPKTTDTERLAAQLNAILGLQVSDRTEGGELCFMRAGNRQHHTCSLIKDSKPGLHHYAWAFWRFTDFLALGDTPGRSCCSGLAATAPGTTSTATTSIEAASWWNAAPRWRSSRTTPASGREHGASAIRT